MSTRRNGAAPALGVHDSATFHNQLGERLVALCGVFKIVEPPQISPVDGIERAYKDHWIQVQVDLPRSNGREVRNYWKLLRETLSLISAIAAVDHDACVDLLTTSAKMAVPASLDLSKQRLYTRFILDFGDRQQKLRGNWNRGVNGDDTSRLWLQFEVLFQPETAVRVTNAIREALRESTTELLPIETQIRINFNLNRENAMELYQSKMLGRLSEALMAAKEGSRAQDYRAVQLKLESIYLDMRTLGRHPKTMKAITALLKTGVTVETLHLPSSISIDRHDMAQQAVARANLMCAMLDNPANLHSSKAREVNVRGFATSRGFTSRPEDYEAFYSAIAGSRKLKTLYLRRLDTRVDDLPMMWLAYALFSKHSSVQVEIVQLDQRREPVMFAARNGEWSTVRHNLQGFAFHHSAEQNCDLAPPYGARHTTSVCVGGRGRRRR